MLREYKHLRKYLTQRATPAYDEVTLIQLDCKTEWVPDPEDESKDRWVETWKLVMPLVLGNFMKIGGLWVVVDTDKSIEPMEFNATSLEEVLQMADDFLHEIEEQGYAIT